MLYVSRENHFLGGTLICHTFLSSVFLRFIKYTIFNREFKLCRSAWRNGTLKYILNHRYKVYEKIRTVSNCLLWLLVNGTDEQYSDWKLTTWIFTNVKTSNNTSFSWLSTECSGRFFYYIIKNICIPQKRGGET
jgi:hypothetical protein